MNTEILHRHKLLTLENEKIKASFLPEIGSKMVELVHKQTGKQFLLESQSENGGYKEGYVGADFSLYDCSGFDDCFPTVSECKISPAVSNENTITFADHGELWSRGWDYQRNNGTINFSIKGTATKYELLKTVSLHDSAISFSYKLTNRGDFAFPFLWSAHPLIKIEEGTEILLPDSIREVLLYWSSNSELGEKGKKLQWPKLNGKDDYSKALSPSFGEAVKLFAGKLDKGAAAVYYPSSDESLVYSFDVKENSYLGIWLCYGGWPVDQNRKHFTIALEPTTAPTDSTAEAEANGDAYIINPGDTYSWKLSLSLIKGKPDLNGLQ